MEKGEIRFHGPTAELLERPDVLRSVFLEGAATGMDDGEPAAVGRDGAARRRARRRRAVERPTTNGARPADAGDPARAATACRSASVGSRRSTDVSLTARGGRDRRLHRPERRRQDDAVRRHLRASSPPTQGTIIARRGRRRATTSRACRRRRAPQLGLGRSFQDGRLFPSLTVARDRSRSRSSVTSRCATRSRAALHLPCGASTPRHDVDDARRASSSSCSASPTSATSSSASSRPGAGASSTSRACSRTSRRCCCSTSRRRASRSARPRRSARCCCASASRPARRCSSSSTTCRCCSASPTGLDGGGDPHAHRHRARRRRRPDRPRRDGLVRAGQRRVVRRVADRGLDLRRRPGARPRPRCCWRCSRSGRCRSRSAGPGGP